MCLDNLKTNQRSSYNLPNSGFWSWLSMESQPQNPEFRINAENFHPCIMLLKIFKHNLSLFILDTNKQVLWQTVKTQMKCHKMWHFIRVCTVCEETQKQSSGTEIVKSFYRNFDQQPLKIQEGQFHTYCINLYVVCDYPSEWKGLNDGWGKIKDNEMKCYLPRTSTDR